jgi:hypothetical protein
MIISEKEIDRGSCEEFLFESSKNTPSLFPNIVQFEEECVHNLEYWLLEKEPEFTSISFLN